MQKVKTITLPKTQKLVSLDVCEQYTSIPLDLVIEAIEANWIKFKKHTDLEKNDFINGIKLCYNTTYFSYEGLVYQQTFGCAMGSPISATLANLVMEFAEDKIMRKLRYKPKVYHRYVDDVFMSYPGNHIENLIDTFNSFNVNLKFTVEHENNCRTIPFLDVRLTRNNNGTITTNWYQKPTNSWRFLNFKSNHPVTVKYH